MFLRRLTYEMMGGMRCNSCFENFVHYAEVLLLVHPVYLIAIKQQLAAVYWPNGSQYQFDCTTSCSVNAAFLSIGTISLETKWVNCPIEGTNTLLSVLLLARKVTNLGQKPSAEATAVVTPESKGLLYIEVQIQCKLKCQHVRYMAYQHHVQSYKLLQVQILAVKNCSKVVWIKLTRKSVI